MSRTLFLVTYANILISGTSSISIKMPSSVCGTCCYRTAHLQYLLIRWISWASLHCRRTITRPVSCYAFFKGWLLPSLPPGCFYPLTSFLTEIWFWDLNVYSGLFPFWPWTLAPKVCLLIKDNPVFGVSLGLVRVIVPLAHWVLYPRILLMNALLK